jgi:hypothetical protein
MLEVGCTITFPLCSKASKDNFKILVCNIFCSRFVALWSEIWPFQVIEDMSVQANVPALAMEEVQKPLVFTVMLFYASVIAFM